MNEYVNHSNATAASGNVTFEPKTAARVSIVDENSQALDALAHQLSLLEERLNPLLRPNDYPTPDTMVMSQPSLPASLVREQLHALQFQTGRVAAILDRLEV